VVVLAVPKQQGWEVINERSDQDQRHKWAMLWASGPVANGCYRSMLGTQQVNQLPAVVDLLGSNVALAKQL
jgi:hypothetical protein